MGSLVFYVSQYKRTVMEMVSVALSDIINRNMEEKKMERQSFIPKDLKIDDFEILRNKMSECKV